MSLSLSSFYTPDYRFLLDGLQVMNQTTPGTFSTSTTATLRSTGENYPDYLVQSGSYVPISVGLSGRVLDANLSWGDTVRLASVHAYQQGRELGVSEFTILSSNAEPNFSAFAHVMAVPEPGSCAMLLAGLGLIGFAAQRRKQNRSPAGPPPPLARHARSFTVPAS